MILSVFQVAEKVATLGLYYDRSIEKVAYMFETNTKTGLSADSIPKLIDWYGPNKLPSPPSTPKWKMLLRQLLDFMTIILIIAAIVSIAVEDEGVKTATVLLIVVVLNVTIGFVQEVKANRALEALMSLSVPKVLIFPSSFSMVWRLNESVGTSDSGWSGNHDRVL